MEVVSNSAGNTNKHTKRDELVKIQDDLQKKYNFDRNVSDNKKKYLVTFPFAYMNGRLHLGHGYTISKVEFNARFMSLNNYNVLFPFGFHGTGTPIVACAKKLKESLEKYSLNDMNSIPDTDQIKILFNMGVSCEEIPKFVDPNYWLIYFPIKAIEDLKSFGACIDFRRSFVTTMINPYFDSFVRWQFQLLNERGYLRFGKKPVIFSVKDNQTCSDHDRSVGEGVNISEYFVFYGIDENNNQTVLLTENKKKINPSNIKQIIIDPNERLITYEKADQQFVVRHEFFRNFEHQQIDDSKITIIKECSGQDFIGKKIKVDGVEIQIFSSKTPIPGSGFKILYHKKDDETDENNCEFKFKYYEPESQVISRTGDHCVVSIIDQWFIDYGSSELKKLVNDFINSENFSTHNNDVKVMLQKASDWIKDWPCSRSFGLGTRLLDTDYVIDSLSDSTIYMAFYTVSHLINQIPFESFKLYEREIWDYVFQDKEFPQINSFKYNNTIQEMQNEFKYWYHNGVDLRVSGKDLVTNHLIMCLYNHAMIWEKNNVLPKSYHINGYILLNGEKMSKSKGNFMTLKDAIDKYGADATRNAMAEAGSSIDDANFNEKNADMAVRRLHTEKCWTESMIDQIKNSSESNSYEATIWDKIFEEEIKQCVVEASNHYHNLDYQKVISNGVYKMLSIRDAYIQKYDKGIIKLSLNNIKLFIENFLLIIYPICPHFTQYLWEYAEINGIPFSRTWPINTQYNQKLILYRDIFNQTVTQINRDIQNIIKRSNKKDNKTEPDINIQITCYHKFSEIEIEIIKQLEQKYREYYVDPRSWKGIIEKMLSGIKDKKVISNYGKLIGFVRNNIDIYGSCYFEICYDGEELCNILGKWIPQMFQDKKVSIIKKSTGDDISAFKYGPTNPQVEVIKIMK